jgi:hypothetical protein
VHDRVDHRFDGPWQHMPAHGNPGQGLAARRRLRPYSRGKRVPSRPWAQPGPLAGGGEARSSSAAPLVLPLPVPVPLAFRFPFAFPFPLLPLALLLAAFVGAVGVFAPLVAGLALWPEIFPVSPVLGTG